MYIEEEKESVLEDEENETYDNLSSESCDSCGARLTKEEFEEFEDTCAECVFIQTNGLIDDVPAEELE